ncbi:MAG: 3-oxoacyl-[acyl-carrier-protein] reductase [Opitutae bacterium]|jgi:3-oxoacyl-[acyl-carrier protein] reductase|nr:3-oxoacyl-[acyl-carrier-protein] reductase [Opitutae bacterium]MBT4225875.1 3-oxoacyl-[acyl-carrier-protein] reductase [Opitutae bacterium]MBT5377997.1 3-oxoacyl-[acyl-carrier-protein] reductase [Opitutae bacterium]MBT5690803.1 3-oxoacyl-[acyl-carrier-protein] reductase [Opitutae bacterium]MBT6464007.1 3-oxoacyl-[acyl-carrier-protein] reductase [Opitutae bacterium]
MDEETNTRIALVTGAGRGIGKAIAKTLATSGHTVLCVSKNESSCGAVADSINNNGGRAHALAVDVSDGNAVQTAAEKLGKDFGTIDILVNNAGITRDGLLFRMSDEDWNSVLETNLTSCFHWCKALGRPMTRNRWGRIINISSVAGVVGNAGQANYAAAKAGMIGLTKTIAKEFAARSVTANAIAPGFIRTDMTDGLNDEIKEAAIKFIPLKRFGEVEDIAHIVDFLCSEKAGYVTGQVFSVDGGMAM